MWCSFLSENSHSGPPPGINLTPILFSLKKKKILHVKWNMSHTTVLLKVGSYGSCCPRLLSFFLQFQKQFGIWGLRSQRMRSTQGALCEGRAVLACHSGDTAGTQRLCAQSELHGMEFVSAWSSSGPDLLQCYLLSVPICNNVRITQR